VLLELAAKVPAVFIDPETGKFDAARFARALQFGGLEAAYEFEDIDVSEAMREEEQFSLMGGVEDVAPIIPQPWQNHEVHWRQHRRTLAGAEWKEWPQEGQQAFLQHFMETEAMRDAKRQQAAMLAATAGTGMMPPGMAAPPQPPQDEGDTAALAVDPLGAEADMLEADLEMQSGGDILN
jgi:hypothetical protein